MNRKLSKKHTRDTRGLAGLLRGRHKGQAIVIIALVMIVLLGFTALAIDGGRLYFLQRDAQNAADAAVVAALWEQCAGSPVADIQAAGQAAAALNGFTNGVNNTTVAVNIPPTIGPRAGVANYVEVIINAHIPPSLIQVVGITDLPVTVRTTGHCTPGFDWSQGAAMYSGGTCNDALTFSGSSATVTGDPNAFHSNGGGTVHGNSGNNGGSVINGNGSSTQTFSPAPDGVQWNPSTGNPSTGPVQSVPSLWNFADFQPGGAIAAEAASISPGYYFSHTGNVNSWSDFGVGHPRDGIYYVDGDISLVSSDLDNEDMTQVTIVATGAISLHFPNSPAVLVSPFDLHGHIAPTDPEYENPRFAIMPALYSNAGTGQCAGNGNCETADSISVNGKPAWVGVIYAPNGQIDMSLSDGGSVDGAIIAFCLSVSGSNITIRYNPDWVPPIPPEMNLSE